MSKIYGSPLFLSGSGGGVNKDLPPLLDNFKAVAGEEENAILVSADKMEESRANELAGAVWVYADHEPTSVNDGTKIQLSRDEVVDFGSAETASVLSTRATAESQPITELASGSKVKLGRWNSTDLQWKVARDSVTGDLRLVLDGNCVSLLGQKEFDAIEPPSGNGFNHYKVSNIHQWLNATGKANQWYTQAHKNDQPPSYSTEPGFLNGWSNEELTILDNMSMISILSSADGGGSETVFCKVALMSTTELGLETLEEGNKLDIFSSNLDRQAINRYWTRTPYTSVADDTKQVDAGGTLNTDHVGGVRGQCGVRPIIYPKQTTCVSLRTDEDGCYTLVFDTSAKVARTIQWDGTKDFFARQFTYNSKKQYQTMLEGAIATLNDVPEGQPITELESGSKVKLGVWNDTPLQWKVARDTSDQSIRLVLEPTSVSLLGNMAYDAAEPSNSDKNRRSYGNNRYIYSNIHQWLNATKATGWYVAQHSADATPAYSSSPGFLNGWSENHIAVLDRATLTTSRANIDGGGTETFVARVALISTTELGLQSATGGGRLDIFNSNGDRSTGSVYWTRTPNSKNNHVKHQVNAVGSLNGIGNFVCDPYGIRPLCSPKSTTYVSLQPDDDGCYTITGVNE